MRHDSTGIAKSSPPCNSVPFVGQSCPSSGNVDFLPPAGPMDFRPMTLCLIGLLSRPFLSCSGLRRFVVRS
jgi:hypothetical protein